MNVTHNLFNMGIIIHLPSGHVMSFTVHSYKLNQFLFWISSVILIHKLEFKKKTNKKETLFTCGNSRLTQKGDFALSRVLRQVLRILN